MFSQNASTASTSPSRDQRGQDVAADFIDVVVGAAGVLGWQRMRGQQRGGDVHAAYMRMREFASHRELLAFMLQRQPVAGFDLDGGDAFIHQGVQPGQGLGEQLLVAGQARFLHRGHDAAALFGDGLVTDAIQALLELVRAVAGVDQVRVAVDEARRDEPAMQSTASGASSSRGASRSGPAYRMRPSPQAIRPSSTMPSPPFLACLAPWWPAGHFARCDHNAWRHLI